MKIKFEKIHPAAKTPTKAYPNDACWDVYSVESATIMANTVAKINTGLRFEIPPGYVLKVYSKSGLASKGVQVYNAPGIVDSSYVGQLIIILGYISNFDPSWYPVQAGEKVAQICLEKLLDYELEEGVVDTNTDRGDKGFGSSGK